MHFIKSEVSASRFLFRLAILVCAALQFCFGVTKKKYDFVVGVNGDFKAAMSAAAKSASSSNRFYIFFPDGEYNLGALTGDTNQKTTFPTSNVSFIGQSQNNTVLYNKSINESIGTTATLYLKANNIYMQDMTIYNKAVYGQPALYNATGRHVAIQEEGSKFIYKRVKLLSTQDTYYTKNSRTYWEDGTIYGTTDFLCGSGDVYFQNCTLYELKVSAISAPSTTTTWGYVFNGCTIDGDVSGYTLGRSWNTAKATYLNTTMKKLPSDAGWGNPMNSVPQQFAEYKSRDASGNLLDLSKRRTVYTKDDTKVTLNPVLTDAQAAAYTVSNVLKGSDNWQPQNLAKQLSAPVIRQNGQDITWDADDNALCWVVFKNGKYLANVTSNSYSASSLSAGDKITVRAANEMGGLGDASNALAVGAVPAESSSSSAVSSSGAASSSSAAVSVNPVVTFVSPSDNASFVAPATVTVEVSAAEAGGSIANVQLFLNGTLVRQENGAPYQWNDASQDVLLRNMAEGTYTLRAVATDNAGNTGEASLQIKVAAGTESIRIRSRMKLVTPSKKYFDLLGRPEKKPVR